MNKDKKKKPKQPQHIPQNKIFEYGEFKKELLLQMRSDNLNEFREEYNKMLSEKMAGTNIYKKGDTHE